MLEMTLFVAANLVALAGAAAFVRLLGPGGTLERVRAVFTCYIAQVIVTVLCAGVLLARLTPLTVFALNVVLTAALAGCTLRRNGRPDRAELAAWSVQPWRAIWRTLVSSPWVAALALLTTLVVVWLAFVAVILPPYAYDGLAYHLPSIAGWIQSGCISTTPYSMWSNVYPADGEVYFTWLALFFHSDRLVDLGQLFFALGGALAVASIGRATGLRRDSAVVAGCLFLLTPIVMVESGTPYVDIAFAAMFLVFFSYVLRQMSTPSVAHLTMVGLSAALTMGMKSTGIAYVAVALIPLAIRYYLRWLENGDNGRQVVPLRDGARPILALGVPALLFVAYWYVRTWQAYGNPVTIMALGHVLFAGKGTAEQAILSANVPPSLSNLPAGAQVLLSWAFDLPGRLGFYIYDQRTGGFGPQWILLEFPALCVYAFVLLRRRPLSFATVVLPFLVIFSIEPDNWWSRFSVFVVALGAIALAWGIEKLSRPMLRVVLQSATAAALFASIYWSTAQINFVPTARVLSTALALAPADRTIGALWLPQYRWVDSTPPGTRIGFLAYSDDYWAVYPFFGSQLQNSVAMLQAISAPGLKEQVRSRHVTYLCVPAKSQYLTWVLADPADFQLTYTAPGGDRIYTVRQHLAAKTGRHP